MTLARNGQREKIAWGARRLAAAAGGRSKRVRKAYLGFGNHDLLVARLYSGMGGYGKRLYDRVGRFTSLAAAQDRGDELGRTYKVVRRGVTEYDTLDEGITIPFRHGRANPGGTGPSDRQVQLWLRDINKLSRNDMISYARWIDPNGSWSDREYEQDFGEKQSTEDLRAAFKYLLSQDEKDSPYRNPRRSARRVRKARRRRGSRRRHAGRRYILGVASGRRFSRRRNSGGTSYGYGIGWDSGKAAWHVKSGKPKYAGLSVRDWEKPRGTDPYADGYRDAFLGRPRSNPKRPRLHRVRARLRAMRQKYVPPRSIKSMYEGWEIKSKARRLRGVRGNPLTLKECRELRAMVQEAHTQGLAAKHYGKHDAALIYQAESNALIRAGRLFGGEEWAKAHDHRVNPRRSRGRR